MPPSRGIQIYPSLLAADPLQLGEAVTRVEAAIDWLHVDVMDYHFVPNLAYSPATVQALAGHTSVPLDCHLMIAEPERWAVSYAEAGAGSVTFHAEAVRPPCVRHVIFTRPGPGPVSRSTPAPQSSPTRSCFASSTWC